MTVGLVRLLHGQLFFRGSAAVCQVTGRSEAVVFRVICDRAVVRCVVGIQAFFHFHHVGSADTQIPGNSVYLVLVHPAQPLFAGAQVKEQLALGLGRSDLDNAPVTQDELVDFSADPVYRKRNQAHAHPGIKTFHGLHQADISFLDQVRLGQSVAAVAACDPDDKTQMRHHQLPCRLKIMQLMQTPRQRLFFLGAEHRNLVHRMNICFDGADRQRRLQCCDVIHETPPQRSKPQNLRLLSLGKP